MGCVCFACLVGGHFSCRNLVLDVITRSGLGPVAFYTVPRVCRPADQHGTRSRRPVPSQSTLTPSQANVSTSIDLDHVETVCTSPRAHNTSWTLPWVGRSRRDVKERFLLSGCCANTSKHVGIACTWSETQLIPNLSRQVVSRRCGRTTHQMVLSGV